ncbi:MAG: hypothetical protein JWN61_1460 [Pseudonocardiales bacterium]|nr:hypothetical protein [Pseudonocardiales bacterium]
MTTADRWAALEPQTDRTEIASSPRWPSLSSAAAYAALDPLEEQAAHQRTVDRARFLHAEQERWS